MLIGGSAGKRVSGVLFALCAASNEERDKHINVFFQADIFL